MQHVFIVGAKGISFYGGYESFIQNLLHHREDDGKIQFHITCKASGEGAMDVSGLDVDGLGQFDYCGAKCHLIKVNERLGKAQAIDYDIRSLRECIKYIKENEIENAIVYVLACRIGPFCRKYVKKLHRLGGKFYLNPDGHEWKRSKWSMPVRRYWKESERLMVEQADLIICDSVNIEKYIQNEYGRLSPNTTYISYGAEVRKCVLSDDDIKYADWLSQHGLERGNMYLQVGRLVPENNFEAVIREFMKSHTKRDLVIIATKNAPMMKELEEKYHFSSDKRIKFVGTVYDTELLMKIREDAYAYIHGHSVGGTNPSLLEALGSTRLNLLYDVSFNREVAEDAGMYWNLTEGSLAGLIDSIDDLGQTEIEKYGEMSKARIRDKYSWEKICGEYDRVFN